MKPKYLLVLTHSSRRFQLLSGVLAESDIAHYITKTSRD